MILGALAMFFVVVTMGGHLMSSEHEPHDAFDGSGSDSASGGSVEIDNTPIWGRR